METVVPRLIYLTPCFQYPLGMPLAAEHREALLDLSRQHDCVVFEDDYDSEFRDDSQPRPALAAEAAGAKVLHAGTFWYKLWIMLTLARSHWSIWIGGCGNRDNARPLSSV